MEDHQVLKLLSVSFTLGYAQAKIDYGFMPPYISLTQAHLRHGKRAVNEWIKSGHVKPVYGSGKNCTIKVLLTELDMCAAASNLN